MKQIYIIRNTRTQQNLFLSESRLKARKFHTNYVNDHPKDHWNTVIEVWDLDTNVEND